MRVRILVLIIIVVILMFLLSGPAWPAAFAALAVPEGIDVTVSELIPGTCGRLPVMTVPLPVVKIPGPVMGGAFQRFTTPFSP